MQSAGPAQPNGSPLLPALPARPPACRVYQALQRFTVLDLSNFYLDVAKDRLYISAPGAPDRRACQTVLAALLQVRAGLGGLGRRV